MKCQATLAYGPQPRRYEPGEPLADLPVFQCERDTHDPESVHWCAGVVWVAKP